MPLVYYVLTDLIAILVTRNPPDRNTLSADALELASKFMGFAEVGAGFVLLEHAVAIY